MSLGEHVGRLLRSPRTALGSATALDLTVRVADVRAALGGAGDLLAPAVSLASGTLAAGRFGDLTTWLLFAVAFFVVTPRILPAAVRDTAETRGFRLVFAVGAVALGWTLDGATAPFTPAALVVPFLAAGALGTACVLYVRFVADWDLFDPNGEAVGLLDSVLTADMRAERRRDRALTGAVGTIADTVHVVGVGTVFVIAGTVLGVLATALVQAYPLPDVLVVAYLLVVPVARRVGWSPPEVGDVEERVLLGAREATRTLKGALLSLLAGLGLFGAAGFLFLGVGMASGTVSLVRVAFEVDPVAAWVAVGPLVCFVVGGFHLSWVWSRTFRRLPAFLTRWRGAVDPPEPPVSRPPLSVAPGLVVFVAGVGCLLVVDDPSVLRVAAWWPVVPAAVVGVVIYGRRRTEHHSTAGEDHRIAAGLLAEYLLLFAVEGSVRAIDAGAPPVGSFLDALFVPANGVVFVLVVGATYLADAAQYSTRHDDYRRLVGGGYLLVMGGSVALLGVLADGAVATGYAVVGAVVVLGGFAVGVTTYYRL